LVYVVDLDDTLVATTEFNNDAYNYALEKHNLKTIKTKSRITRNKIKVDKIQEIVKDKQNYFSQKWLKYRLVINYELLEIIKQNGKENCYLWTSADRNRANIIIKELDLEKYFASIIFDEKKDFNKSINKLKDITKNDAFLIFEDNEKFFKKSMPCQSVKNNNFKIKKYYIEANDFIT